MAGAQAFVVGLVLLLLGACTSISSASDPAPAGGAAGTESVASEGVAADSELTNDTTTRADTSSDVANGDGDDGETTGPSAISGASAPAAETVPEADAVTEDPLIDLPSPLAAQIDGLIATVESIRGHDFESPPRIRALSPEGVIERRAASLQDALSGEDFDPHEALFDMFNVFGEPVDLESFYTEFYAASTLAYYDLDDHELVIPITGELLTPYEQWILVHELTHALADQVYPEVIDRYVELSEVDAADEAGAILGLLEGEAVLVQSLFFDTLDSSERSALNDQAASRRNEAFGAAPAYFRTATRFPYTDGSLFALYLYQRGGMAALDQAFLAPPTTTEEIYAPEAYIAGSEALPTDLRFSVPFGFEIVERGTWGASGWRALLGQFVNGGTAGIAVDGWGGDEYALLWNPETHQVVFVAVFAGDSVRDAAEFGGALEDFVAAAMDVDLRSEGVRTTRFTGADYAEIQRVDDRTLFIAASNHLGGVSVRETIVGFRR